MLLLGILAAACLIAAICTAEDISATEFVVRPFGAICAAIRDIHEGGNVGGAWCLYIFIGILPLVIPAAICAVRRRFCPHSLIWVALSVCTFAAIYMSINRQLFASEYASTEQYYSTIVAALCFIWLGVAMICVFTECSHSLTNKRASAYTLGQIVLYLIAAVYIVNSFYLNISGAAYDISLLKNAALPKDDYCLNIFAIAMHATAKCLSTAATTVFLSMAAQLLGELKRDSLSARAVKFLKTSVIAGCASVTVTVCLALISNIVVLSMVKSLFICRFAVSIPLSELISVCLAMIAIEILKRAIAADEENKLTI